MAEPLLKFDFSGAPTLWSFLHDDAFVRGVLGPVGSGKSTACAAEILLRAVRQAPSVRDGVKKTRFVVARNSYPELRTTTIKTWLQMFPEHVWGKMRWQPPITHHLRLPARDGAPAVDCEVIFLALDRPEDVKKLLSLEITGAWVNEARELPKSIIDGLTSRVGRYPSKADGGPTWRGVWMDTNPPDDDHWWYRLAEGEPMEGLYPWRFWKQPAGVLEVGGPAEGGEVRAGGKWWSTNPDAENLDNLPGGYYAQMLAGKSVDWIRCYVQGRYVFVQDGRPVWPEYDDVVMSGDVEVDGSLPLQVGLDFGLTPAAVIGQRTKHGQWRILSEIVTEDMGLERFGDLLKLELETQFPGLPVKGWGDPAGKQRDAIYETTAFEFLQSIGLTVYPTHSNNFRIRREAAAAPMNRMVFGKPGLIVSKRCPKLRKSLAGGYHFKRVALGAGQERFKDEPNKDQHSHVGDAFGYLMLGGGEHAGLTRGRGQGGFRDPAGKLVKQFVADHDFDPMAG
jgi:hypothetical protein